MHNQYPNLIRFQQRDESSGNVSTLVAGGENSVICENIAVQDTSGSVSTPPATPLVALLATSLQGALSTQFKHSVKVATQFQHFQLHINKTPLLYFYTDENMPPSLKISPYTTAVNKTAGALIGGHAGSINHVGCDDP